MLGSSFSSGAQIGAGKRVAGAAEAQGPRGSKSPSHQVTHTAGQEVCWNPGTDNVGAIGGTRLFGSEGLSSFPAVWSVCGPSASSFSASSLHLPLSQAISRVPQETPVFELCSFRFFDKSQCLYGRAENAAQMVCTAQWSDAMHRCPGLDPYSVLGKSMILSG